MGGGIQTDRDLRVWQEAMTLAEDCYRLTKTVPREELFGMTSQIRRSAASIPANIAEGYGRETTGAYVHSLRIAQGSLKELETHLILSERVNLSSPGASAPLTEQCEQIGRMLRSLIRAIQNADNSAHP
jgi:four helix bundle protein